MLNNFSDNKSKVVSIDLPIPGYGYVLDVDFLFKKVIMCCHWELKYF